MKITTNFNRNFDLLCFLNVATDDEFYIKYHEKEYKQFYPLLSNEIKTKIEEMAKKRERTMLWPVVTLLLSSLNNYENRDLIEMLQSHDEIITSINKSPYKFTDEEMSMHFGFFDNVIIPFIKELESIGFAKYWEEVKKPLLIERCAHLNAYLDKFNILDEINNLMPFNNADIRMWVCAFARPHGAKLCGYDMISDYEWKDETILLTVTHEMFHPPYDAEKEAVVEAISELGEKPWVIKAYENQHPNCTYKPMDGFIEENIVEALGIFLLKKMIKDFDAHKYFKEHDYGSHVISPRFYDYLHSNPKNKEQGFEEYFIGFTKEIICNQ